MRCIGPAFIATSNRTTSSSLQMAACDLSIWALRLENFSPPIFPVRRVIWLRIFFQGRAGHEASDLYAPSVIVYRRFAGAYHPGEIEPFVKPRFGKYGTISHSQPDLLVWLDVVLAKGLGVDP